MEEPKPKSWSSTKWGFRITSIICIYTVIVSCFENINIYHYIVLGLVSC
jgi:hypothetical protein